MHLVVRAFSREGVMGTDAVAASLSTMVGDGLLLAWDRRPVCAVLMIDWWADYGRCICERSGGGLSGFIGAFGWPLIF